MANIREIIEPIANSWDNSVANYKAAGKISNSWPNSQKTNSEDRRHFIQ